MLEGWKCPGCGACFAPFVKKCDTCIGSTTNNYTNPPIQMPQCQHIWGAPQTHGTFCTLCGVQQIPPPPITTTCQANLPGQHDWLGSSHGDYCVDCGILKDGGGNIDITGTNCGVRLW